MKFADPNDKEVITIVQEKLKAAGFQPSKNSESEIERLRDINGKLVQALQSMMNDSGLVKLMRHDQIERNLAALKLAND